MPPAVLAGGLGALSAGSQVMQGVAAKKASDAQANADLAAAGEARQAAGARIASQDFANNAAIATGTAYAAAAGVSPAADRQKSSARTTSRKQHCRTHSHATAAMFRRHQISRRLPTPGWRASKSLLGRLSAPAARR